MTNHIPDEEFDSEEEEEDEGEYEVVNPQLDPGDFHFFYSNECDACTFLCSIVLDDTEYDLWIHRGHGAPTIFARYGDEEDENLGGTSLGNALRLSLPSLPEDHQALRIAWLIANDLGLLPEVEEVTASANTQQPA